MVRKKIHYEAIFSLCISEAKRNKQNSALLDLFSVRSEKYSFFFGMLIIIYTFVTNLKDMMFLKSFYYTIKTLFYFVALLSIITLMRDYKHDRERKAEVKKELRNFLDDLQK